MIRGGGSFTLFDMLSSNIHTSLLLEDHCRDLRRRQVEFAKANADTGSLMWQSLTPLAMNSNPMIAEYNLLVPARSEH